MASAVSTGRQLPALFLITFVSLMGFGVVLPVFPFFGKLVNASPAEITLAMAAYSAGQFIGAPIWGKLSDRHGRRPILIATLIGSVLSYVILALSQDILVLGVSRLFAGLMAGNIAAAFAYVGDITTPEDRPKAMGMIGASFGLGFILGPAIGGVIAGNHPDVSDFASVGFAAGGITLLAAIAAWFLLPESLTAERRAGAGTGKASVTARQLLAGKPVVWLFMALIFLVIGSASMMETTLAFFAFDMFGWGPKAVGYCFAMVGLISAALQGAGAGPLARQFGSGPLAVAGVLLYALGLGMLAFTSTEWAMIGALAVTASGLALFNPAFQTISTAVTDDSDRGLVMGLTQGASSLGRIAGPAFSGLIYQTMGRHAPFTVSALLMLLALGLAIMSSRKS